MTEQEKYNQLEDQRDKLVKQLQTYYTRVDAKRREINALDHKLDEQYKRVKQERNAKRTA
jgi:flagellar hook-associated protein FlgK